MNHSRSSASRFWLNFVPSTASRDLTSVSRAAAAPSSCAPDRTNIRRYNSSTRRCSASSPSASRSCHNASIRANNPLLLVISEAKSLNFGARSLCNASRASLLSAPTTL